MGLLPLLDGLAQPSGAAADIEHAASGVRDERDDLGPGISEIERVGAGLQLRGMAENLRSRGRRGRETSARTGGSFRSVQRVGPPSAKVPPSLGPGGFSSEVRTCAFRSPPRARGRDSLSDWLTFEVERELVEQVFRSRYVARCTPSRNSSPSPLSFRSLVRSIDPQATASKTRMLMSLRMLRLNAMRADEYVCAMSSK